MTSEERTDDVEAPAAATQASPPAPAASEPSESSGPDVSEPAPAPPTTPPAKRWKWSTPSSPVTREQADEVGRAVVKAGNAFGRIIAGAASLIGGACRGIGQLVGQAWRGIGAVPATVRLALILGVLALLGVVGSVAAHGTVALACAVVVVPVCSLGLGVLWHRWYLGQAAEPAGAQAAADAPALPPSDMRRSVEYVDRKLAVVLEALGTERHQHAIVALFQAKTAVEFALGTEADPARDAELPAAVDEQFLRPRIRAGAANRSLREGNSLAAS